MKDLEKLKEQYKKLGEEIEKLEKGNTGRWELEKGEEYWYIDADGDMNWHYWRDDDIDNWTYINHNTFKTKEDAQKYKDYILARAEYTYEFLKEEWENDNITKYNIFYDYFYNKLCVNCSYSLRYTNLYFKTKEKAQEFIDKYEKQILKYEFGIEEK